MLKIRSSSNLVSINTKIVSAPRLRSNVVYVKADFFSVKFTANF
jgi:hypothetical protein